METYSALVVICAGNSTVTGEFPAMTTWKLSLPEHHDSCSINGRYPNLSRAIITHWALLTFPSVHEIEVNTHSWLVNWCHVVPCTEVRFGSKYKDSIIVFTDTSITKTNTLAELRHVIMDHIWQHQYHHHHYDKYKESIIVFTDTSITKTNTLAELRHVIMDHIWQHQYHHHHYDKYKESIIAFTDTSITKTNTLAELRHVIMDHICQHQYHHHHYHNYHSWNWNKINKIRYKVH